MATDKLRKASSTDIATVATVLSPRLTGATTLAVNAGGLTNWATTSTDFNTYTLTAGVVSNMCSWTGKADLDNDLITDLELTSGTDVGNSADDIVVCVETAAWVNDVVDSLLNILDQTGALKANSIPSSAIVNGAISTIKLADLATTIDKMAVTARQQVLDIDGSTELVYSAAATQPTAQAGKTIIWFAPSS